MQKDELIRDVADKKSKIDDLEGNLKDFNVKCSSLSLKVEQLTGRATNLDQLKSQLEKQLQTGEDDYESMRDKKDQLKQEKQR